VARQVVAGTNYRMELRLRVGGPGCSVMEEKKCAGVAVHKPLDCREENFRYCLQLMEEENIQCQPDLTGTPRTLGGGMGVMGGMGGFGVMGGHSDTAVTPEIQTLATHATESLLNGVSGVSSDSECSVSLVEVVSVARQVVAGTNYRMELRLRVGGPGCSVMEEKKCAGVAVHKPLDCREENFRYCLQLMEEENIQCQPHLTGTPRCEVGNTTYSLGDVFRIQSSDNVCRACSCNSPPHLTCYDKVCPSGRLPRPPGGVNCVTVKDSLGCCDVVRCDPVVTTPPPDVFIERDCTGQPCGAECGVSRPGVCDGQGVCVSPEENPCLEQGCGAKECGEECLQGDIIGTCDSEGECVFFGGVSCSENNGGTYGLLGGGGNPYQMLGGFSREHPPTAATKLIAAHITRNLLSSVFLQRTGCEEVVLLEILEVHKQVVAGTNIKLKLRLRQSVGVDCLEKEEVHCEDILVFKPLRHNCMGRDPMECLTLEEPHNIQCTLAPN